MCNGVITRSLEEQADKYVKDMLKGKDLHGEVGKALRAAGEVARNSYKAGYIAAREELERLGIKLHVGDRSAR